MINIIKAPSSIVYARVHKSNEALVREYQAGNRKALDILVKQNEGLINKFCYQYYTDKTNSIDIEDLRQEGFVGLVLAAKRYDFTHESRAQFSTYAVYWITQKMNRFIKTRNTNEETSINKPVNYGDDVTIEDILLYKGESTEEIVERKLLRAEIEEVLKDNLSLKERQIVKLRNGWYNNNPMTLEATGSIYGHTRERIRQFESNAYRRLRKSSWGMKKRAEIAMKERVRLEARRYESYLDNEKYIEQDREIKRLYDDGILTDPMATYIASKFTEGYNG